MQKKFPKHETFDYWWEAFDVCRERDRPLVVRCDEDGVTEFAKIYPSGHAKTLHLCSDVIPPVKEEETC
jgi:hypothetical protein